LAFAQLVGVSGKFQSDLYVLLDGKPPVALLSTPADERSPALSPDGRWIAYVSNVSGRDEVYITSLSSAGATVPVSASGGFQPAWARDARSLFYREADRLLRATFDASTGKVGSAAFVRDLPRDVFGNSPDSADYDVGADGSLILIQHGTVADGEALKVILNWSQGAPSSSQ
jgi:hypothetical protein